MLHENWRHQYDRMKRSFELLKQVGERTAAPQDVIPARDVVYHCCCDVFHLRDYIAASLGTDPASRKQIERQLDREVIKPSEELSACRDVANGSKHLVLDGKTYLANGKHAEVISHNIGIGVPPMRAHAYSTATATVTHPDGSTDADDAGAAQSNAPTPPTPVTDSSTGGYIQDTFVIEINGQHHDARDVAAEAIAAWDAWLRKQGMI
jgi:hypothetical protein